MTSHNASRHPIAVKACALAIAAALGCAHLATAHAENLMDVYRQALTSDPVLKQAEAGQRIGQAGAAIARAPLLPQLNGNATFSDSHGTNSNSQLLDTPTGPVFHGTSSHQSGRSRNNSLTLNQTLFNLGEFEQWRAGKASANASEAQYTAAQQDLILRVAQAYFTVLTDEDQLKFAQSNADSLKKQLDQAQAKYDVGFAAITDVADAKASYDTALAQVIAAKNTAFNDRQALAQITGRPVGALDVLTDKLPMSAPTPDDMEDWVQTALANNPTLQAQRDQLQSAQHDVNAAHSAHLPSLGASVTYSQNPSWSGASDVNTSGLPGSFQRVLRADNRTTDTTVGLVLTVPLFQGGGIIAREKQAIAQRDQSRDLLEQDRRATISNTRNAFNAITAGISSVQAQKAAVASAKTALDATQAGYEIGTQTIVNLLIAQSNYFSALSAYSQARHALVINQLNLKYAAGTLSVKDLEAVNALLL
ncbi:MAG: type I secretion protein TolC [Rhodanobacteraceae bacterium]|nr:MAG: type I secretion protein TolC [Rhodanobacteraceae bacterium]